MNTYAFKDPERPRLIRYYCTKKNRIHMRENKSNKCKHKKVILLEKVQ